MFVPDVSTRPFGSSRTFSLDPGKMKGRCQGTLQPVPASDFFRRRHRFHVVRGRLEWIEHAYSALCTLASALSRRIERISTGKRVDVPS